MVYYCFTHIIQFLVIAWLPGEVSRGLGARVVERAQRHLEHIQSELDWVYILVKRQLK